MSAKKVQETDLGQKALSATYLIEKRVREGQPKTPEELQTLIDFARDFSQNLPFEFKSLKPKSFYEFLNLQDPTQAIFNQLSTEIKSWNLLDQIEISLVDAEKIELAKPFLNDLFAKEISNIEPFKTPDNGNWKYKAPEEQAKIWKSVFGSSIKINPAIKLAKQMLKIDFPQGSEGIAIRPKLFFLHDYFFSNLDSVDKTQFICLAGSKVYVGILLEIIKLLEVEYKKATGMEFVNLREGQFNFKKLKLTPAGSQTHSILGNQKTGDFSVGHSNTGSIYAGHSQRLARKLIALNQNQMPMDAVMVLSDLITHPERITERKHLGIDISGNVFDCGDGFASSLFVYSHAYRLKCGAHWSDRANSIDGSGVLFLH